MHASSQKPDTLRPNPQRLRILPILIAGLLTGCTTVQNRVEDGAQSAGRAISRAGDRIEENAETVKHKTSGLWNRIFGRRTPKKKSPPPAPVRDPAPPEKFDTYPQEYIGP